MRLTGHGTQGSGPALASPFAPSVGSATTGSGSLSAASSQDGFGPFAHGQPAELFDPDAPADDDADFGGESYTAAPRRSVAGQGDGSARSGTSGTRTSSAGTGAQAPAAYYQHAHAHTPALHSPLSPYADAPVPAMPLVDEGVTKRTKKRRKSRPHALSVSGSSGSASASSSSRAQPLSPPPAPSPGPGARVAGPFEGFPGDFGSQEFSGAAHAGFEMDAGAELPAKTLGRREDVPATGFPSVGLGGVERRKSDAGVFLARRGDE